MPVRDGNVVKHYRIRQLDNGGELIKTNNCLHSFKLFKGFFIARRVAFGSLQELVQHYQEDADGLCVILTKAAIKVEVSYTFIYFTQICTLFRPQ